MLGVGIDWAEEFHDIALGNTGERSDRTVPDCARSGRRQRADRPLPGGWSRTRPRSGWCSETRHGLLVEALLDAGFTLVPVNPDLVARRRGPARKKDDAEDARICCLIALDRHAALKPLVPHGEIGGEMRALGNRWLEVLWQHRLRQGVRYDESVHQADRNRALGRAA